MRVFRSILAAREALIAEMGELAERTVLAEAEEARHWLPHTRRMRLVASKR
jgi:hypothetical protein